MTIHFPLLFPFLLILLTLIVKRVRRRGANSPPSPWKLPLIGNIHQLFGTHTHRALRELSQIYGEVMHLKLGQVDHIVISSAEAAREILTTHDRNFASRPELIVPMTIFDGKRNVSFSPYGSYWRQLRKICVLELLSPRRVKSFRHIREQEGSALVASISNNASSIVNLSEKLPLLASTMTARAAFGSECKHGTRFVSELKTVLEHAAGFNLVDLYPSLAFLSRLFGTRLKLERARLHMDEILDEIITEHEVVARRKSLMSNQDGDKEEEEDLVDVLLRLKDQGGLDFPLDIINIKAVTLDMYTAGTETSSTVLIWAMAELVRHPTVMEKVQREVRQTVKDKGRVEEEDVEDLEYLKLVVKETLRLHPPVPLMLPRVCGETCNVGGYQILSGSRVFINAWAIGRDPRCWGEDAEIFKPERFEGSSIDAKGESFQYLPFGGGRRMCPGIGFGLASVELALSQLLFHFNWDLPEGKQLDMTESFGVTTSLKSDLCLTATPWLGR